MSCPSLDWSDPIAVSKWLAGLWLAFNDADAVALDMLRPPRARELGPALNAANYSAARAQILYALDFATAPEPDPEPSDPACNVVLVPGEPAPLGEPDPEPSDPACNRGAGSIH